MNFFFKIHILIDEIILNEGNPMKNFKYLVLLFAAASTNIQASWNNWQEWYNNYQAQVAIATSRLKTLELIRENAQEDNRLNETIIPLKEVLCELDSNKATEKNGNQIVTGTITTSYQGKQTYTPVKIVRTAVDNNRSNTIDFNHALKAERIKARNFMVKHNVPTEIKDAHARDLEENF